jgi:hypothetical protein
MLTDDEAAELAALRLRAYGPEADLDDDPEGLARLAALEAKARAAPVASVESDAAPVLAESAGASPADPSGEPAADPPVEDADGAESAVEGSVARRRMWSPRAVLAIGIPVLLVASGLAAGVGAMAGSSHAVASPAPKTTLAADYVESWHRVSGLHAWDEGSPRLLADIAGTLVWGGTTATGTMTCIVVEDPVRQAASNCGHTGELTQAGLGVGLLDPESGEIRTYTAWPNGAPTVTYTTDAGARIQCRDCTAAP